MWDRGKKNRGAISSTTEIGVMRKRMGSETKSEKKALLGTTHRGINLGTHNWIQMQI